MQTISFILIDTTLALDNHLRFRKNLLERIQKLVMATDDKIRYEKLQYNINREKAKYHHHYQIILVDINTLQVKKYFLLIEVE